MLGLKFSESKSTAVARISIFTGKCCDKLNWRKYIHNKYFYSGLAFVVWMIFFDQENIIEQFKLSHTLNNLQNKKSFYESEINKNELNIHKLETDSAWTEKFAREKYFMKKDDEDVFVIIREND